jgi:hypothetical protein
MAWKSGGQKLGEKIEPDTIPESLDVGGTTFGSFAVKDGQIQIPKDQLDIALVPNVGVDIKVGVKGHAHLQNAQNPKVPSLSLQDITADVHIIAPIGPLVGPERGPHDIGVQLKLATQSDSHSYRPGSDGAPRSTDRRADSLPCGGRSQIAD